MNATITGIEHVQFDYKVEFRGSAQRTAPSRTSNSRQIGKRRGKGPQLFNGIHRRRRKSIVW